MSEAFEIVKTGIDFFCNHLVFFNMLFAIVIVFFQRRDPKSVWAWLLLLYFIPVLGFVFYLLLGQDMHKRKMFRTKEIEDRLANAIRRQELMIRSQELKQKYPGVTDYSDLVMYHLHTTSAILSDDNDVEFFVNGEDKFAALKEDMRNAKKSIHIQYYIIKNDELFRSIVEILKEKVKEGVKVRILYDSMGCWKMRKKIWKQLEKEGVPTHLVEELSDRETAVKKVSIVPLEVIVRNVAAGSFSKRMGVEEGKELLCPIVEFSYKCDELNDPFINDDYALALGLATQEEIDTIKTYTRKVNEVLKKYFLGIGIKLIDFKIEFGRLADGTIILADEISPDTCRLWDVKTNEKLDKDRFRRDLGGTEEAYQEVMKRIFGE